MLKLQGLNKAIGDYHRANSGGPYSPKYGVLMLDKSTGEIWTDEFYDLGHNHFAVYKSDDIINLGLIMENDGYEITRDNIKEYCLLKYRIVSKYLKYKYIVKSCLVNGDIISYEYNNYKEALVQYKNEKNNRVKAYKISVSKVTLNNHLIQELFFTFK